MNPPLSYIDPANVGSISVMAGITPVSHGGDSIGGTIAVDSAAPAFAQPSQGVQVHGGVSAFHRTNGVVNGGDAWLSAATAVSALATSVRMSMPTITRTARA